MNTSYSWIKAYVPDLDCTYQEYSDRMTLSGTKVEEFRPLDKNLEKIVVGEILKIDRHPDADKLVVCQVNIGDETTQIVTGAPNVREGQKVPVVLAGGKVAGGHDGGPLPEDGVEIKAGKLRGVESNGMMCSIEELGSSREFYPDAPEGGIYILPPDSVPGSDALQILGLRDAVYEYEITSNRVDCYSVLGIAREAAATFKLPFKAPSCEVKENKDLHTKDLISVEIKDSDLCSQFCARVCTDVKIGPSPEWMQRRLASVGIRPINNLVDITNYVMAEYGQPMHAYDLDDIAGRRIIVKRASDGEKFVTLDGQERELDHDVLTICDGEKAVGIAGIMGGENSMITENVKTVLFEAATFNGTNVRKSSRRIGLRTDASSIFEKGLEPHNAIDAINRACELMNELSCGTPAEGMVRAGDDLPERKELTFKPEKYNSLLGTDVSEEEMRDIFKRLEIGFDEKDRTLKIPYFRQDLLRDADIAEEVARFYGYDRIPVTLPSSSATMGGLNRDMRIRNAAASSAEHFGFSQAYCYSFESPKIFDMLRLPEDAPGRKAIRISNPLGEDFSIMRTVPLGGMLTSLASNYNHRNRDVRLYELGNVYIAKELPLTELPDERMTFTAGFYGKGDFFTLKGLAETVFKNAGLRDRRTYKASSDRPYLHPGRQAEIFYGDELLGYLGEVHPLTAENFGIGGRAYVLVIDMPNLVSHSSEDIRYGGFARFPAVTRDISMLVPLNVTAGELEALFLQRGGKMLESVTLFDVYQGEQVKEGYKSMAYSLVFRSREKTLSDDDVNAVMKKYLNGLERMGIELRS